MSTHWSERFEKVLVIAISGFALWPNNITNVLIIALLLTRIIRERSFPEFKEIWLLIPAILILLAWVFHGFASDGLREIKLWPIWLAGLIYWYSSPFRAFFQKSFIRISGYP